jgi:hypothetical protein
VGNSQKGFTLIDILIVLSGGIAVFSIVTTLITSNARTAGTVDLYDSLVEKINENILEINAKTLAEMPLVGNCLVRNYDEKASFLNETTVTITSPACNDVATAGYKIVWKATDPAGYTFSSDFLKLPKLSGSIRQIQVTGSAKIDVITRQLSISLMKEKK